MQRRGHALRRALQKGHARLTDEGKLRGIPKRTPRKYKDRSKYDGNGNLKRDALG